MSSRSRKLDRRSVSAVQRSVVNRRVQPSRRAMLRVSTAYAVVSVVSVRLSSVSHVRVF